MDRTPGPKDLRRWRRNVRDEIDGAALYRAMAESEPSTELAKVYRGLADIEERHARFWTDRLRERGARVPAPRPSPRARALRLLARRFGAAVLVPTVARTERLGRAMYDDQVEAAGTSLPVDERSHAFLLGTIRAGVPGSSLGRLEGRQSLLTGGGRGRVEAGARQLIGHELPKQRIVIDHQHADLLHPSPSNFTRATAPRGAAATGGSGCPRPAWIRP